MKGKEVWVFFLLFVVCSLVLLQCSFPSATSIAQGKALLAEGKYGEAKSRFLDAGKDGPDADALVLAATASYKAKDIPEAIRLIQLAEKNKRQGATTVRMAGYKALILYSQGKEKEGEDVLRGYIRLYNNHTSMMINTAGDTRAMEVMLRSGRMDVAVLEKMMDYQMDTYEEEFAEIKLGTKQGR
jgi:hypothetical protein